MHSVFVHSMRKMKALFIQTITNCTIAGFIFSLAFAQPHSLLPLPNSLVLVILAFAKKITRYNSKAVTARKEVCLLLGIASGFYRHSVASYLAIL